MLDPSPQSAFTFILSPLLVQLRIRIVYFGLSVHGDYFTERITFLPLRYKLYKTGLMSSFFMPKRKKALPPMTVIWCVNQNEEQDEGGDCCIEMRCPLMIRVHVLAEDGQHSVTHDWIAMWNKSIIGWWIRCFGAYQTHSMDIRLVFLSSRVMSVELHSPSKSWSCFSSSVDLCLTSRIMYSMDVVCHAMDREIPN